MLNRHVPDGHSGHWACLTRFSFRLKTNTYVYRKYENFVRGARTHNLPSSSLTRYPLSYIAASAIMLKDGNFEMS